jgi:hypothetical protein
MTASARSSTLNAARPARGAKAAVASALAQKRKTVSVSREALQVAIEDAQLNAIADERADGPFVRVSLDEL